MRRAFSLFLAFSLATALLVIPHINARAQAVTVDELINTVNQMRASYGLAPYVVDSNLMAMAQAQSDYQASLGKFTHSRADGSGPQDYAITAENVGGGLNISPHYMVYTQWSDSLHTKTLVGFTTGLVGAGATTVDGVVYFTLDVKNTGKVNTYLPPTLESGSTGSQSTAVRPATAAPISPMTTVTPASDGSIIHIIQPGQTLWNVAISYGLKIADLVKLNPAISTQNPVVFPGQKIVVRLAFTPTISPTITDTSPPPTSTPRPTFTPRATRTITTEPSKTMPPILPDVPSLGSQDARTVGIGVVVLSVLGLLAIIFTTLRGGRKSGQ